MTETKYQFDTLLVNCTVIQKGKQLNDTYSDLIQNVMCVLTVFGNIKLIYLNIQAGIVTLFPNVNQRFQHSHFKNRISFENKTGI